MSEGDGRVAVVTGGNRGIGLELVRQLAADGFTAILGSRDLVKGEAAAAPLRSEGLAVEARQIDVADEASVSGFAAGLDRLDVLVNNAAIHYDTWESGVDADLRVAGEAFETNVLGAWRMAQACLPALRGSTSARIVNVSSGAGQLSDMGGGAPAYRVTKAALNALTRVLASELRSDGILVNSVCPGWVATDMGGAGGRPVADGAASVMWAVRLPDDGPTGGFFRDGRRLDWVEETQMKIGIIGSGKIGGTLTRLFAGRGHEVAVANSRGPGTLGDLVAEAGDGARAATVEEAADFGDLVVVAVPVVAYDGLPADRFDGKVVVDAGNYYPARDGQIESLDSDSTTSTELLGERLRGARMVKAFNTMNFRPLGEEGRPQAPREQRLAIFLAGDDEQAKGTVAGLIDELGFAPLDTGSLAEGGRRQQPGAPVYNNPMRAGEAEAALGGSG